MWRSYERWRKEKSGVFAAAAKVGTGTRRPENVELSKTMLVSRQTRNGSVEMTDARCYEGKERIQ